jgi:hypothetical protein
VNEPQPYSQRQLGFGAVDADVVCVPVRRPRCHQALEPCAVVSDVRVPMADDGKRIPTGYALEPDAVISTQPSSVFRDEHTARRSRSPRVLASGPPFPALAPTKDKQPGTGLDFGAARDLLSAPRALLTSQLPHRLAHLLPHGCRRLAALCGLVLGVRVSGGTRRAQLRRWPLRRLAEGLPRSPVARDRAWSRPGSFDLLRRRPEVDRPRSNGIPRRSLGHAASLGQPGAPSRRRIATPFTSASETWPRKSG